MRNNIFKLCDTASNEMINELDTIKQSEMKYYITASTIYMIRTHTHTCTRADDGQFEIDKHIRYRRNTRFQRPNLYIIIITCHRVVNRGYGILCRVGDRLQLLYFIYCI